jgi:hypothetical protein
VELAANVTFVWDVFGAHVIIRRLTGPIHILHQHLEKRKPKVDSTAEKNQSAMSTQE